MLDLNTEKINHNANRFSRLAKYGNVLCGLLNNFGGRHGIYGDINKIPDMVKNASQKPNFKGIALTAESTNVNPIVTDIFFSTIWENIDNVSEWSKKYALRRYGKESEHINESMEILLKTAYGSDNGPLSFGATETMGCRRPLDPETKRFTARATVKTPYSEEDFDKAVELFLEDFDEFKNNKCYIYDAVDLLRQSISNKLTPLCRSIVSAYKNKNYAECIENGEKLLSLMDTLDRILLNNEDFTFKSYIEPVKEYTDKLDDFTRELYMINAKALITTWYCRLLCDDGNLHDYAHRQLGDHINSFHRMRWEKFIEHIKALQNGEKPEDIDWFKVEWDWVLGETTYTKKVRHDDLKVISKSIFKE